jgi:dynein heavy chain
MPSERFPVSILQNGIKLTMEPPAGIRANLLRNYSSLSDEILNDCMKVTEWKKLLFSLSLFHAIVQERRKFGALGWNIPYEFSDGDLRVCIRQLRIFLNDYESIPFKVLRYTAGQLHYGGRVTDGWDSRLITTILDDFYTEKALKDGYCYSLSLHYQSWPVGSLQDYTDKIRGLPMEEPVEAFCLDANANITYAEKETNTLLSTLVSLMPKSSSSGGGGGKSREEQLYDLCKDFSSRVPPLFDTEVISKKYPSNYNDSLSTVLVQEAMRYNRLLDVVGKTLKESLLALKGQIVMSEPLEVMCNAIYINSVPAIWANRAYPSLKPLGAWFKDLEERIQFFRRWIDEGPPSTFWMSGFFFPQAFLTAVLQNFARKHKIPIDQASFEFQFLTETREQLRQAPDDGCYIYGLYVEGARWDGTSGCLTTSRPKELFTLMPVIWFLPKCNKDKKKSDSKEYYTCPVYRTLQRAGTLSTTGHSTNYILTLEVPSSRPESFWIKRGVAMICALNY